MDAFFRLVYAFALNMNDRLVFRDFKPINRLTPVQTDVTTMRFGLSIGNPASVKSGIIETL